MFATVDEHSEDYDLSIMAQIADIQSHVNINSIAEVDGHSPPLESH